MSTAKRKGLILVNTGNGKGKTTAALGMALRAWGQGMKVLILQFIKGGWKYGELKAARKLAPDFEIRQMGEGFIKGEDDSSLASTAMPPVRPWKPPEKNYVRRI